MPGQLNCRAGGRALNKENRVCVMYTWEISGDGGRRKVVIPPHILLRLYRAGLIRNRHGLFVLSEPVLPNREESKDRGIKDATVKEKEKDKGF